MPHARPQPGKWSTSASDKDAKENNGPTRLGASSTEKEGLLRRAAPAVGLDDGGGEIATGGSADRFEQEAEQVADTVTRPSAAGYGGNFPVNEEIRRKGRGEGSTVGRPAQQQIESLKGGGKPLSPSTRSLFEPRFGEDFSEVRVHTGDRADAAARSIGAAAFTQGKDIAFRSDRYRPGTQEGKRLLAHELTHVVQQAESSRRTSGHREGSGDDRRLVQRQAETEEEESSDADEPCALTTFTTANFTNEEIVADRQFVDSLRSIDGYAASANVTVHVTHSFRTAGETPEGAIVEPANRSNHLAGHAIDMNLRAEDGEFHNSRDLHPDRLPEASEGVRGFLQSIRDDGNLRWGGDFGTPDPVHIDDHLNASESEWRDRYEATQEAHDKGCM